MKIELTDVEREMVWVSADFSLTAANAARKIEGNTIDLTQQEAGIIAHRIEKLIQAQETDQGDWLRAKEYRDAKSGLIKKLRGVILRLENGHED